jgi:ADP-heptose:LPS heptosyltransferase
MRNSTKLPAARGLILRAFQSPGDVVVLTAAVRDLQRAFPGRFLVDVRASAPSVWEHNPRLTPLVEGAAGVETIDMHYPLVHHSNARPYHFLHGYVQHLEGRLGLRIPVTEFRGEIFLSDEERASPPLSKATRTLQASGSLLPDRFWIVVAGGKYDFTAKWWDPAAFQAVVDHFCGRIAFVQCNATP